MYFVTNLYFEESSKSYPIFIIQISFFSFWIKNYLQNFCNLHFSIQHIAGPKLSLENTMYIYKYITAAAPKPEYKPSPVHISKKIQVGLVGEAILLPILCGLLNTGNRHRS